MQVSLTALHIGVVVVAGSVVVSGGDVLEIGDVLVGDVLNGLVDTDELPGEVVIELPCGVVELPCGVVIELPCGVVAPHLHTHPPGN